MTLMKAQAPADACFAIGYAHAHERSWQHEFNRRATHEEQSEVFGADELDVDKLLRTQGITQAYPSQTATLRRSEACLTRPT